MTDPEHTDSVEAETAVVAVPPDAITTPVPEGPQAPAALTDEEVQDLQARAAELVEQLGRADGSRELQLIDGLASLGTQTQRHAGAELDLLRAHMKDIFESRRPERGALDRIDPQQLGQQSRGGESPALSRSSAGRRRG